MHGTCHWNSSKSSSAGIHFSVPFPLLITALVTVIPLCADLEPSIIPGRDGISPLLSGAVLWQREMFTGMCRGVPTCAGDSSGESWL